MIRFAARTVRRPQAAWRPRYGVRVGRLRHTKRDLSHS